MFLAAQVVLVRAFRIEGFLAGFTSLLEAGAGCGGGGGGFVGEDALGEDFAGDGREGGDAALEIVSVPVALHVLALEFGGAEGDLAGVAGICCRRGAVGGRVGLHGGLCVRGCGKEMRCRINIKNNGKGLSCNEKSPPVALECEVNSHRKKFSVGNRR